MASAKEKKWLNEYFQCWNATEAARRAGYKWPEKQGWQKKVKFSQEIEQHLKKGAMAADEVIYRLASHARSDLGAFLVKDGAQVAINWDKLVDAKLTHLVKSITPTKYGTRIEFHDAQAALVHLGKHHGLFTDKVKVTSWRDEVVELLRKKQITPEQVIDEFGSDIGSELVESASHRKI